MAITIKSPSSDIAGKPKSSNRGGPGQYDGLPGYQKRTPSPNAVPEKLIDGADPKPLSNIRTPGEKSTKL